MVERQVETLRAGRLKLNEHDMQQLLNGPLLVRKQYINQG